MTAHALSGLADEGQPEASPFVSGIGMNPFKKSENALLILRFNPKTVVLERNPGFVAQDFARHAHLRGGSGGYEFHGIAQEVGNTLGKIGFIAPDRRQGSLDDDLGLRRLPLRFP